MHLQQQLMRQAAEESSVDEPSKSAKVPSLYKPSRGLPPHQAEDPAARPCGCGVCQQVPASQPSLVDLPAAAAENGDVITGTGDEPVFVGIYPQGLGNLAIDELNRKGATVVSHLEEHVALLFHLPLALQHGDPVELSTFELLFELVSGTCALPPAAAVADIAKAADVQVRGAADTWRRRMRRFSNWRISVHRYHLVDHYKAPEVAPVIGDAMAAVGAISLAVGCTAGPVVDLVRFDVEVVVYLSDGIDKLRAAADTQWRASLDGKDELLLLGLRYKSMQCRPARLTVEKGDILSRADDTVAFCVAQRAADLLERQGLQKQTACETLCIMDPMCGVGTYILAMRWVLERRSGASAELLGLDVDEESVWRLWQNAQATDCMDQCGAQRHVVPLRGSSLRLPVRSNSIDLIIVDPPWGQRHGAHTSVKQGFPKWAREWARVLKPGGFALVVTICKKVFENQVMPPLQQKGLLELEEAVQFNNKGWTVCRLYTIRKPTEAAELCN